jgi:hypothetical protein
MLSKPLHSDETEQAAVNHSDHRVIDWPSRTLAAQA